MLPALGRRAQYFWRSPELSKLAALGENDISENLIGASSQRGDPEKVVAGL
jgi:hypothetical protein